MELTQNFNRPSRSPASAGSPAKRGDDGASASIRLHRRSAKQMPPRRPSGATLNPLAGEEIEHLAELSKRGDADAFGQLYDRFINSLHRYMYFRVGGSEAEDLTELVFLKTWENIRQYRPALRGNFSSWIFRIAHNVVVDHYRSRRNEDELTEDFEDMKREANATARAHQRFDKEFLSAAMKKLRDPYRQILILKYMEDMANDEIAFIMGRSNAALRILQFRALKSLRRVLEQMGISEENA